MEIQDIKALVAQVDNSSINELTLEQENFKIVIRKTPEQVQTPAAAQPAPAPVMTPAPAAAEVQVAEPHCERVEYAEISSPIVGTFYAAPSPDADPYVKVGDKVRKGDVLCIVEAMKIMNEIESEHSGTIVKILGENAKPVEFGQTLFLIEED